ncbi:hypothetical protein NAP1_11653 [Erythrobacter sp. NAP1]|nr:hypothetical protein NAP1_11653 [Erythrobacter sp. NAP1]
MFAASPAHAQTFVFDVDWGPVERFQGLDGSDGPQYGGGMVSGTYSATNADGSADTGMVSCVGTGQPEGGIFAIHLSCKATSSNGSSSSFAYGCNYVGEAGPNSPISCVGGIQGRSGDVEGWRGALTMYWYSAEKATGTGQWFMPAE